MNPAVATFFLVFLWTLVGFVVVRAILSWVPNRPNNDLSRLVYRVTDPLMEPVRKFLPPLGGLDLSGIVVIVVLQVMIAVVNRVNTG
ncbi:MAG: YggT family protein [Dehalococcoidia bacterium]